MISGTVLIFKIVNFPHLSSNIPSGPAYGVYISHIGRICSDYTDFALRHKLTDRLINQGYRYSNLCRSFYKFAKKHQRVVDKYNYTIRRHIEDGVCLPAMISRHVSCRLSIYVICLSIFLCFIFSYEKFSIFYIFYTCTVLCSN